MNKFQIDIIEHTDTLYHAVDSFYGIQMIVEKTDDGYEGKLIDENIPIRISSGDDLEPVAEYLFSELSKLIIEHIWHEYLKSK